MLHDLTIDDPERLGQAAHPSNRGLLWPSRVFASALLVMCLGCVDESSDTPSVSLVELTDSSFQQEVIEANQPMLVEFWAPWCQPCLEMERTMEKVAEEFSGRARVARMRIDENPVTVSAFSVQAPPTVIVFRDGEIIKRRYGKQSEEELAALLSNSFLGRKSEGK